ncbi:MAG TPA: CPBP family intramembrane glutamic endopeptidase [Geobacteraceae bacterium]
MKKALVDIVVSIFIVLVIAAAGELLFPNDDINTNMLITIASLAAAVFFLALRYDTIISAHNVCLSDIGIAIIVGILSNIPFVPISTESFVPYVSYNSSGKFIFVLCIFILLPISEEIYFRGLLYKIISKYFGICASGIITVFVFTLAHIGQEGIIIVALSGIMYTWLTYRAGNAIPAILAHSTHNLVWFIAATLKT